MVERDRWGWVAPALGILFVVLFVAITLIFGEGQDATEKTADEIVDYYQDHDTEQNIAAILVGIAATALLFFAGYLRRVLYRASDSEGFLPTVAWGGAIVFASGAIFSATIHLALADLSDDTDVVEPVVLQTLNALDWDNFLFFPVGLGTLILATGISAVRSGALPRWLAWLGVVVGVLFFTPVFYASFFGGPLFLLITSIVLLRQERRGPAQAPPPAPPATVA